MSVGKAGGDVVNTYTIRIIGGGTQQTLSILIYDFSGSSFHYNSDYAVSYRFANIIDPTSYFSFPHLGEGARGWGCPVLSPFFGEEWGKSSIAITLSPLPNPLSLTPISGIIQPCFPLPRLNP